MPVLICQVEPYSFARQLPYICRVVDYSYFRPGRPNPELFEIPALCKGTQAQAVPGRGHKTGAQLRWAALAPSVRYHGDPQVSVR